MKHLFKKLKTIDGKEIEILIEDGYIKKIGKGIKVSDAKVESFPRGTYVSPGWIDSHTHASPFYPPYSSNPDDIGWKTGVTTVIDAGSIGSDDLEKFYTERLKYKTKILSLINISKIGLKEINELKDLSNLNFKKTVELIEKYPDFIIGFKVRLSATVVGENGVEPLMETYRWNKELKKPIMVHIGSAPPEIKEVLKIADENTIITHFMNGKKNNILTAEKELELAIGRGIKLDVGHGGASFSFEIAKECLKKGFKPNTISSDIYRGNMKNGPVYSLETTLNKFLLLGLTLKEVIDSVTKHPKKIFSLEDRGELKEGLIGDLTFFKEVEGEKELVDSYRKKYIGKKYIKVTGVCLSGEYIDLEGEKDGPIQKT